VRWRQYPLRLTGGDKFSGFFRIYGEDALAAAANLQRSNDTFGEELPCATYDIV
jgi:hypothetical protein